MHILFHFGQQAGKGYSDSQIGVANWEGETLAELFPGSVGASPSHYRPSGTTLIRMRNNN